MVTVLIGVALSTIGGCPGLGAGQGLVLTPGTLDIQAGGSGTTQVDFFEPPQAGSSFSDFDSPDAGITATEAGGIITVNVGAAVPPGVYDCRVEMLVDGIAFDAILQVTVTAAGLAPVDIEDGDFADADYDETLFEQDPASAFNIRTETLGGNAWRVHDTFFGQAAGQNTNFIADKFTGVSYTPSAAGAIQSMNFSVFSQLRPASTTGAMTHFGLCQAGEFFFEPTGKAATGTKEEYQATGLTSNGFNHWDPMTGAMNPLLHPDLTAAGGQIFFIIGTSITGDPGEFIILDYDDFAIRLIR